MYKKIIITGDFGSYNTPILKMIEELGSTTAEQVFTPKDAISNIRNAFLKNSNYELLITDLSASESSEHLICEKKEFIHQVKKEFPDIKIIVFSVESDIYKIQSLFETHDIDGFVTKGPKDIDDLKEIITEIYKGGKHISYKNTNFYEFTNQDIEIASLLAKGMTIEEISAYLKKNEINPNSESYINKRLMILRQQTGASNTTHLLFILANWGLIE
ncbi:response regulator transcription factor [Apibacter raozihei]|uniref:helix-turn-helix transcriptional regulator n=1 Tax=Apibacter raozihei TaxID=2500547 RepID=UPI000FE35356|nr:response regulator transcription factor [Apibacter raozihei]